MGFGLRRSLLLGHDGTSFARLGGVLRKWLFVWEGNNDLMDYEAVLNMIHEQLEENGL